MPDGSNQTSAPMLYEKLTSCLSDSISREQLFFCLLLVVCGIVALVHLPSLASTAFFLDDQYYVTRNPLVQDPSWKSAARFFAEVWKPSTVPGYYHPLAMVSLMVDRLLAGPYEDIRVYHRTSLALHVANTALVAVLLYLLLPNPFLVGAVALLFGLHPMTVESVCWLSERKTVLSSFFALLSLIAYVKFARGRKARFYIACVVAYVLALLSKPIALPLPFMMILLDYWPFSRLRWRSISEKLPLFSTAGVFTVIGCVSQRRASHIFLTGQHNVLQAPLVLSHNAVFYLCKLFWPVNLSPHYEPVKAIDPLDPNIIGSVIATCLLIALLLLSLRWTRALFTGCLMAFLLLFTAGGIVTHTNALVANRYLYLSSIGLLPVLALGLSMVLARDGAGEISWPRAGVIAAVVMIAGAEGVATRHYMDHWSNTRNLYEYMLAMFPRSSILRNDLGVAFRLEGRSAEAVKQFRQAIRDDPISSRAHYNLALILDEIGGHTEEVIRHYRRALQINPRATDAHVHLGLVLSRAGDLQDGVVSLRNGVAIDPQSGGARLRLGQLLVAAAGQPEEGLFQMRKATEIDPRLLPAWKNLAWLLATHPDARVRDPNGAIEAAERAWKMTGDRDASVLDILAAAYASGERYSKAVETAGKAIAVAKRLGADDLAGQIEERLHLYENRCPYYENPRVQLDRLVGEAKKKQAQAGDRRAEAGELGTDNRQLKTGNQGLEVQDGTEAISAE